ncbi:MAG TPA: adenylyl-sulfate kinase [Leptolyngbyaceae cyanobacterium M33_DOE_097]|uniref:Adenylyl-sulfate kinase n=1 Tax=Oscillatoriales cyanobacterium SpSt-418 TaxID=2282169 RepID=A0A7C3PGD1_9CYAN|nr:adenylyl-sulfate kinase [Leptolyngbyaceae cyanobacterium M33_DOE_097]
MNSSQKTGFTCWLTGLSGAGKSTLATALSDALVGQQVAHELLDGDVVRTNLSKGLGFSREDRDTNVLRVGFVCSLLNKHSINTIVALISPYEETRAKLRAMLPGFIEIYVNCPLDVCIERDPKGLYRRAIAGEIPEFTGISSPYEPPNSPEIIVSTHQETVEESVDKILNYLSTHCFL